MKTSQIQTGPKWFLFLRIIHALLVMAMISCLAISCWSNSENGNEIFSWMATFFLRLVFILLFNGALKFAIRMIIRLFNPICESDPVAFMKQKIFVDVLFNNIHPAIVLFWLFWIVKFWM